MSKILLFAISALVLGSVFLFLRAQPTVAPSEEKSEVTTATPVFKATPSLPTTPGTKTIKISGQEFGYNPQVISVKTDEDIRIIFTNQGRAPHDLFIQELNKGTKLLKTGEEETLALGRLPTGTYTFYCTVPGHRSSGMEGQITVE